MTHTILVILVGLTLGQLAQANDPQLEACQAMGGVMHPFDRSCRITQEDGSVYIRVDAKTYGFDGNQKTVEQRFNPSGNVTSIYVHSNGGNSSFYSPYGNGEGTITVANCGNKAGFRRPANLYDDEGHFSILEESPSADEEPCK